MSHLAASCPIYREFCDTHCKKCNLMHKTAMCRETSAAVHLGEIEMEEEIPVTVDEVDQVEEIRYEQQEELLPLQDQGPEFVEEDAWNLYEENDYYVPEEELSPFDLY